MFLSIQEINNPIFLVFLLLAAYFSVISILLSELGLKLNCSNEGDKK